MKTTKPQAALDDTTLLDYAELEMLAAHARREVVDRGTVVVREGDRADSIYIILDGRVKVFLRGEDGREVVLNVHGPGEYFGEMILDQGPRSASVMTMEDSELLVIAVDEFRAAIAANPDFAMKIITRLMRRVRRLTENVRNLALMDVYGRIARLLLELAEERDGRLVVAERFTQKEIAERVGASREMVSRILKDLAVGGYITVENREITINRDLPQKW